MDLQAWNESLRPLLKHVLDFRRELHAHPELSGHENGTKLRIARELTSLGMDIKAFDGCCSLMGTLRNGDGPCVAIRADMDALPIREETGLPFSSVYDGVMHACGHDVHMALSLGSALWLSAHRDAWKGTVKWLFESEEETVGGGQRMVAQGCMREPDVRCIIGQHMNPQYPMGSFYARSGCVSGYSDELEIIVRGSGCHGAYPHRGVDAIVIAAQIVTALQTLVSRTLSPFEPAVVTVGTIHGGNACNVVCGEVRLTGTIRSLTLDTRELLRRRVCEIAEHIARSMGGDAEAKIIPGYDAVYNDPRFYRQVEQHARELVGEERMVEQKAPSLGVESFCFFLKETPGVYYDLGCGVGTGLHTSTFRVDEDVIPIGIALQCEAVMSILNMPEETKKDE